VTEAISINQVFAGDCRAPSGLAMTEQAGF